MSTKMGRPLGHHLWDSGLMKREVREGKSLMICQCQLPSKDDPDVSVKCTWSQKLHAPNGDAHVRKHAKDFPDVTTFAEYVAKATAASEAAAKAAQARPLDHFVVSGSQRKWDRTKPGENVKIRRMDRLFGAFLASSPHSAYRLGSNPFFEELMAATCPQWDLPKYTKAAELCIEAQERAVTVATDGGRPAWPG